MNLNIVSIPDQVIKGYLTNSLTKITQLKSTKKPTCLGQWLPEWWVKDLHRLIPSVRTTVGENNFLKNDLNSIEVFLRIYKAKKENFIQENLNLGENNDSLEFKTKLTSSSSPAQHHKALTQARAARYSAPSIPSSQPRTISLRRTGYQHFLSPSVLWCRRSIRAREAKKSGAPFHLLATTHRAQFLLQA